MVDPSRQFFTLDSFDLKGKVILLRLDLNSPIHPLTGEILSESRMKSHIDTINDLRSSKIVIIAHQSRPGKNDFTSLREHSRRLQRIIGRKIAFVDSLFNSEAVKRILEMKEGDIMMLENTRFYSEDVSLQTSDYDIMENTNFVKNLSSVIDFFINDAFPAIHRPQTSLIGFTRIIPNIAGRLIEKEVTALDKFLVGNEKPKIAILGGAKIDDSIAVSKSFLEKGIVEKIIVGGVVGNAFLYASGFNIGKKNIDFIEKNNKNHEKLLSMCKEMIRKYPDRILMPDDFILSPSKKVMGLGEKVPDDQIMADIGPESISKFRKVISKSKGIFVNGPMGMYEFAEYAAGTLDIFMSIAEADAVKIAGGGHTISVLESLKVMEKIDHVSTGGGALISYLSGEKMPVLEALRESYTRFSEVEKQ
ncbi:MAG: phosphoglycerate kinase [Thermoplasmataceae archaeon]